VTPEGRVKAKLKRWLTAEQFYQFWPVLTGYGTQMVDCLAWRAGTCFAIECKREGVEEPTPRQGAIMRAMRKVGVKTYLVTMRDGELVWLEQKD